MENILEVRKLCKAYKGFRLKDVSFSLPRGFIMGLIGPNGSGKTTTIKLILNLVHRSAGDIRIFGLDSVLAEAEVKQRIGTVFDEPCFYKDVSLETLKRATRLFYDDWNEETFQSLAAEFELPLRKKFKHLSQGMQSKFALALALSHDAELLILDEPTSGLDPVFRRQLLHVLQGLIGDGRRSVLFSTHITSDLDHVADFVTFLREGEVMFSTSMEDLRDNWAVVRGGREVLQISPGLFEGMREGAYGIEALTRDVARVREVLPPEVLIEGAHLEDILVMSERRDGDA